ncbi:hypothetical protein N8903_00880 [Pelagibacterales bacterium]|nr:hypothetical protein [Pelagibacterales bacterium]
MIKKFISIIFVSQLVFSCGFTPTLKNLDNQANILIYYEIDPKNSYTARKILNSELQSIDKSEAKFLTKINVIEQESAVNIKSSGSVDEYKIEVLIKFEIFDILNNVMILTSQSRGFENYDVSSSEYTNSLIQNESLERALIEGIQLMNIIIQSKITE